MMLKAKMNEKIQLANLGEVECASYARNNKIYILNQTIEIVD